VKHLVFVGAGHAHLYPLQRTREFVDAGARVTLIAAGEFWYSGMGPGMVSHTYEPSDDTVDVQKLVECGGGAFIKDEVVRIDAEARELQLHSGDTIRYDVLSLNVGSEVPLDLLPGAGEFGAPVKPIKNLLAIRETIADDASTAPVRVVMVGGGAASSEVSANVWHLLAQRGCAGQVTLVASGDRLLQEATPRAARILANYLRCLGVEVILGAKGKTARADSLELSDGRVLDFDHLLIAIGIRAPSLLREAGLPCAKDGSMHVNEFLQCTAHPNIFGAGDCICLGEKCLPRIGVYAVRQAPILHHNLLAFLAGESLRKFEPQKSYLLILNLGDGTGLLTRGRFSVRARWVFWLKNWLDRRFVRKFQT
jgi:NADH dehydrogenase FAD-containing subunit